MTLKTKKEEGGAWGRRRNRKRRRGVRAGERELAVEEDSSNVPKEK